MASATGKRSGEERLLDAGRAIFARTGQPPGLRALEAESGLSERYTRALRRRLVAAGRWPWPATTPGSSRPVDARGLTALQARWLEVFGRQGIAGGVNLMAAAREMGVSRRRAHQMYRLLDARGLAPPPLAAGRPKARDREPRVGLPTRRQIARRAAAIRREREAAGLPAAWAGHGVSRRMRSAGAMVYDHRDVNP